MRGLEDKVAIVARAAPGNIGGGPRVDEQIARHVAAWFLTGADDAAAPAVGRPTGSWRTRTDVLLRRLVHAWRPAELRLVWTTLVAPYDGDGDLIHAVRTTGTLEIPAVGRDRRHPLLGQRPGRPCDRFRALHDLLGHVVPRARVRSGRRVRGLDRAAPAPSRARTRGIGNRTARAPRRPLDDRPGRRAPGDPARSSAAPGIRVRCESSRDAAR